MALFQLNLYKGVYLHLVPGLGFFCNWPTHARAKILGKMRCVFRAVQDSTTSQPEKTHHPALGLCIILSSRYSDEMPARSPNVSIQLPVAFHIVTPRFCSSLSMQRMVCRCRISRVLGPWVESYASVVPGFCWLHEQTQQALIVCVSQLCRICPMYYCRG